VEFQRIHEHAVHIENERLGIGHAETLLPYDTLYICQNITAFRSAGEGGIGLDARTSPIT
jgi:hypothetical protein